MRWIVPGLLLVCSSLAAAPVRLALLGDKNHVDVLTAEFYGNPDFELLERSKMELVMMEHQLFSLHGSVLKKMFPHADVIAVLLKSHIELFHAQNGTKLLSRPLEMKQAAKQIEAAVRKYRNPDARIVSISFVNTIDLSSAQRAGIAAMLLELQDLLTNADRIQLLERNYLAAVQTERDLSGAAYPLLPSETMVHCEFRQGGTADEITLDLRLFSGDRKMIFQRIYRNLQRIDVVADDICRKLNSTPASGTFSPKKEAARYLEEYYAALRRQPGLHSNLAPQAQEFRRMISAMRVLDPGNPRYRYEEIYYDLSSFAQYGLTWEDRIEILTRFVRDAKAFLKQYPKWRFPSGCLGFTSHPTGLCSPIHGLFTYNQWSLPTQSEANELDRLTDEIRAIHIALLRKNPFRFNNPVFEQEETIRYSADLLPHFDAVKAMNLAWQADLDEIALFRKYAGEKCRFHRPGLWYFPCRGTQTRGIWHKREAWGRVRDLLNTRLSEMEEAMKDLPPKKYEAHLVELKFLREYLNSDGKFGSFKRIFAKKIQHAVKTWNFRPAPRSSYGGLLEAAAIEYFRLERSEVGSFVYDYPYLYVQSVNSASRQEKALTAAQLGQKDQLLEYAQEIRKLAYRGICKNDIGNMLQALGVTLYRRLGRQPLLRGQINKIKPGLNTDANPILLREQFLNRPSYQSTSWQPEWQEVLDQLNAEFRIHTVPLSGGKQALGSIFDNGKVYTLWETENGITLYCWNPEQVLAEKRSEAKLPPCRFHVTLCAADNQIWCGGSKWIAVFDLSSGDWRILTDMPGNEIRALTVVQNRIFYLCGAAIRGLDVPLSLHSCDTSGKNRRTLWDARSRNADIKTALTGEVSGFFPGQDGLLYFTIDDRKKALLLGLDPKTETVKVMRKYPTASGFFKFRRNGNVLLGEDGGYFGSAFYTVPADNPAAEPMRLLAQDPGDKRTARCRIPGYHAIQHPAVLRKNRWLCRGGQGYGNWILDLDHPEKSPLLLLPETSDVFYDESRDRLYYIGRNEPYIYEVQFK